LAGKIGQVQGKTLAGDLMVVLTRMILKFLQSQRSVMEYLKSISFLVKSSRISLLRIGRLSGDLDQVSEGGARPSMSGKFD